MTNKDKKDLAKMIAEEMKGHQPVFQCPHGITSETAESLKDLGKTWKIGKKTLIVTFFAGAASGLGGLIWLGLSTKIKSLF